MGNKKYQTVQNSNIQSQVLGHTIVTSPFHTFPQNYETNVLYPAAIIFSLIIR